MEIHQPGTEVLVGGLLGIVAIVQISSGVMYKVSWWDGSNRKSEWFEDFEVKPTDNTLKTKIGFKT